MIVITAPWHILAPISLDLGVELRFKGGGGGRSNRSETPVFRFIAHTTTPCAADLQRATLDDQCA